MQQSEVSAFIPSVSGLDLYERRCLTAISVFEGSFTLDAADAVVGPASYDTVFLLRSLVAKSLVVAVQDGNTLDYYLPDSLRAFVREHSDRDVIIEACSAYVAYYLSLIERLTSEGSNPERMVDDLGKEWHNIERALQYALDGDCDVHRTCQVMPLLSRFWAASGRMVEGLSCFRRALQRDGLSRDERVALLDAAARMASYAMSHIELEPLARELTDLREQSNDPKPLGDALFMLANATYAFGRIEEAQLLYNRALENYTVSGYRDGRARVLGTLGINLGQRTLSRDGLLEALDLLEQALVIFRELEDPPSTQADALENLAVVCRRVGYLQRAMTYAEEALHLYQRLGNTVRAAASHTTIADIWVDLGQPLQAITELQAGRRAIEGEYRPLFNAYTAEAAFKAAIDLGTLDIAAQLYGFAAAHRRSICVPLPAGEREPIEVRYATLEQKLEPSTLPELLAEGEQLEPIGVDELLEHLRQIHSSALGVAASHQETNTNELSKVRNRFDVTVLERGRVSLRIKDAAAYPVVFVLANGRWGKSIAVEQYLARFEESVIRLKLNPAVASVQDFLVAFHSAISADISATPARLTRDPVTQLSTWLSGYNGAIVLENFQHTDQAGVAPALCDVMSATAGRIRWFIVSRQVQQAPLGLCHAYDLTGEPIDERDLAFTIDDVLEYAQLLKIGITHEEATWIVGFTEGWPLAIGIALRAYFKAVAKAPQERRRHVESATASLVSAYWREDVYQMLTPAEQRIFLTLSAMPHEIRLDCLRVIDRSFEPALSRLRSKLPIWSAPSATYRLPNLLKRFLQDELRSAPGRTELCRDLALAYEEIRDPASAIRVYLEIGEYEAIVRILIDHSYAWDNGEWPQLLEAVRAQLPPPLLNENPTLILAQASIASRKRFEDAQPLLELAHTRADVQVVLRVACLEAALYINHERPARSILLQGALDLSAGDDPVMDLRAKALLCCALVDEGHFDDARVLLEGIARPIAALVIYEANIDVLYWTALAHYRLSEYDAAREIAVRIVAGHGDQAWLVVAQASGLLARIANDTAAPFEETLKHYRATIAAGAKLDDRRLYATYLRRRCALLLYHGRLDLVEEAMNHGDTYGTQLDVLYTAVFRFLTELQRASEVENPEKATVAYGSALNAARAFSPNSMFANDPFLVHSCYLMTACLANDTSVKESVDELLSRTSALLNGSRHGGMSPATRRHLDMARLTAVVCQLVLGENLSLPKLNAILDVEERDVVTDAVRAIVRAMVVTTRKKQFASRRSTGTVPAPANALSTLSKAGYGTVASLLTGLARRATNIAAAGVALTPAESEVLRLMEEGLSAARIAERRHCSKLTIDSQQRSIYRKLGVNSAALAVSEGRKFGLL